MQTICTLKKSFLYNNGNYTLYQALIFIIVTIINAISSNKTNLSRGNFSHRGSLLFHLFNSIIICKTVTIFRGIVTDIVPIPRYLCIEFKNRRSGMNEISETGFRHALMESETMTDIGEVLRRIDVCQGKQNK